MDTSVLAHFRGAVSGLDGAFMGCFLTHAKDLDFGESFEMIILPLVHSFVDVIGGISLALCLLFLFHLFSFR